MFYCFGIPNQQSTAGFVSGSQTNIRVKTFIREIFIMGELNTSLILWKAYQYSLSHCNGVASSTTYGKARKGKKKPVKQDTFLLNLLSYFPVFGGFIVLIALFLAGSKSIPFLCTVNLKKFQKRKETPKAHLEGFILNLQCLHLLKTLLSHLYKYGTPWTSPQYHLCCLQGNHAIYRGIWQLFFGSKMLMHS